MRPGLVRALGEERADEELSRQAGEAALPKASTISGEWFATGSWSGRSGPVCSRTPGYLASTTRPDREYLFSELREAFQRVQAGERYTARNKNVFEVTDS